MLTLASTCLRASSLNRAVLYIMANTVTYAYNHVHMHICTYLPISIMYMYALGEFAMHSCTFQHISHTLIHSYILLERKEKNVVVLKQIFGLVV